MALRCLQNVVRIFSSILLIQGIASPLWPSSGLASYVLILISQGVVQIPFPIPDGPNTECVS